jgi:predicted lipid carrier protein YhbT
MPNDVILVLLSIKQNSIRQLVLQKSLSKKAFLVINEKRLHVIIKRVKDDVKLSGMTNFVCCSHLSKTVSDSLFFSRKRHVVPFYRSNELK